MRYQLIFLFLILTAGQARAQPSPPGFDRRSLRVELLTLMQRGRQLESDCQSNLTNRFTPGYRAYNVLSRLPDGRASLRFSQGEVRKTSNPTNLAINGQGWFGVKKERDTRYTRDGRFAMRDGRLTTEDGRAVLGFPLDSQGNIVASLHELVLPMDPMTKLYGGIYKGFHFDETGKFYGESTVTDPVTGQTLTGSHPLWQLALFQFAGPEDMERVGVTAFRSTAGSGAAIMGVPGQGAVGAICPGCLEASNFDEILERRQLSEILEFEGVLGGGRQGWEWGKMPHDIRLDLARAVEQNPRLYRACLDNLKNQLTPGYQPHDILGYLLARGRGSLRSPAGPGSLWQTNEPLDLAIEGSGYFVLDGGLLTRDGRFRFDRGGLCARSRAGGFLMGYRPGSPSLDRVVVPADATNLDITTEGELRWTRLGGDGKLELGYTIALGTVAHPARLEPLGACLRPTAGSGRPRSGRPNEGGAGAIAQGYLEMPGLDVYEQRIVADALRYLAGLPANSVSGRAVRLWLSSKL